MAVMNHSCLCPYHSGAVLTATFLGMLDSNRCKDSAACAEPRGQELDKLVLPWSVKEKSSLCSSGFL